MNLLSRKSYERQKYRLQVELLKLQAWVRRPASASSSLFEGRDAAGKGGTIKRFMEHLNPRGARVVALEKPTERRARPVVLPALRRSTCRRAARSCSSTAPGTTAPASSGSWASARDDEYAEFLRQVPEFERHLVRCGIHLFKFWFSVSRESSAAASGARSHPLKQWKLTPIDMASLDKWDDYTEAKEAMFVHCDTADAPWTVIKSDCKKRARLNAMRYLLQSHALHERRPDRSARSIRSSSAVPRWCPAPATTSSREPRSKDCGGPPRAGPIR